MQTGRHEGSAGHTWNAQVRLAVTHCSILRLAPDIAAWAISAGIYHYVSSQSVSVVKYVMIVHDNADNYGVTTGHASTYSTGGSSVSTPISASSSGWEMVPRSIIVVAMAEAHFSSAETARKVNDQCRQVRSKQHREILQTERGPSALIIKVIANEGRHGPAVSAEVKYETDQRETYSRFWWRRLSLA